MNRSLPAFALAGLVYVADQVSKWFVLQKLELGESVVIIPGFFSLTLIYNSGAAWGMFRNHGFGLALLAAGALVFLTLARRHFTHVGFLPRMALGCLLGGIAGNLTDRLFHKAVVDFLNFYIGSYHWPAFNVADSAICTGVGLYLIDSIRWPTSNGTVASDKIEKAPSEDS